ERRASEICRDDGKAPEHVDHVSMLERGEAVIRPWLLLHRVRHRRARRAQGRLCERKWTEDGRCDGGQQMGEGEFQADARHRAKHNLSARDGPRPALTTPARTGMLVA